MSDLTLWYASHIGVRRIVEEKVIPKNQAAFLQHTKHFASDHFFHRHIRDGRKNGKLKDEIKIGVTEREPRGVAMVNLHS